LDLGNYIRGVVAGTWDGGDNERHANVRRRPRRWELDEVDGVRLIGGIGGQVVRQALEAGHQVTAVVRDRGRFTLCRSKSRRRSSDDRVACL
jgi:hypothetical protein